MRTKVFFLGNLFWLKINTNQLLCFIAGFTQT